MEPSIQYARSADGVNIAYWTHGDGYPIIQTPSAIGLPTRRAWQVEAGRQWYDGLARGRRLVRFDNRGFGESQRGITSFPLDFEIVDLETVVDHLSLDRFALFAYIFYGPTAIAYAARHPERVSHLILWCTSPRDVDMGFPPALDALRSADWDLYLQTMALMTFGWADPVQAAQYAQALRESMSPESTEALSRRPEHDVTSLLPSITAPTLVLHRRGVRAPSPNAPRELAAAIPNARLAILEGDSLLPYVGNMAAVLEAIDEFLSEPSSSAGEPAGTSGRVTDAGWPDSGPAPARSPFRTILFTDIVGHTPMMQRLGDAAGRAVLREHERITREQLAAHGGIEVKTIGDAFMASFTSATAALECAIALQRAFSDRNASATEPLEVRIGLNAGEPIAEEGDYFGAAVTVASRIMAQAAGGEILASNVVRELCAGKGFLFADRGVAALKGFDEPTHLYQVRWLEPA